MVDSTVYERRDPAKIRRRRKVVRQLLNEHDRRRRECSRHSQARWFAMVVREAGPSLPSRQKWSSLHKLAVEFLKLLEADLK